jgi:cytosine/adenosine deaminase-related metal-dependent hydrolase
VNLLRASWIAPVSGPPLRDGCVAVDDAGVIHWVGHRGDADEPEGTVRELGEGVLIPGLINAHCHLELSHCRGLASRVKGFVPWVEALVQERGALPPEESARHLQEAIRYIEMETGTVAIGDVSNSLDSVAPLSASGLYAVVFHELVAWDAAVSESVLASSTAQCDAATARCGERVRIVSAAHAPHSVSPALLRALRSRGGPYAVHLAESPSECRFFADGGGDWPAFLERRGLGHVRFDPPGVSPVRYLCNLGVLHSKLLAAHAVHVDAMDIAILAQHGVSVVLCPSSNRNLDVGMAPVPRLIRGGVNVCLGTDSVASGDGLDVAQEMTEIHRRHPELSPRSILRMATAAGAAALRLPALGAIEPGRQGAFAFAAGTVTDGDPERFVVSGVAPVRRIAR